MFMTNMYLFMFLLILSFVCLIKKYFLMYLISMEYFLILNMFMLINNENLYWWFFIFYLIISVCEAVIGLSLIVSLLSILGNQSFMMMNLKC